MNTTTTPRTDRSAFGRRLTQIRAEGRARSERSRQERTAHDVLRSQKLMGALEFLDGVEERAIACLEQMAVELPGSPKVSRTVFDGRYMVVMRLDEDLVDREGRRGRYFTRLAFLLEPDHGSGRFSLEARATVRDRDLESGFVVVDMSEGDALERLAAFAETSALTFAQRFFSSEGFTTVAEAAAEEQDEVEPLELFDADYGT